MSNNKNYEQVLPLAEALKQEDIKVPYIRVDIYIQEAKVLQKWCIEDRDKLLSVGLSEEILDTLLIKIEALQEAQTIWKMLEQSFRDSMKLWNAQKLEAISLKKEMLHLFKFAFRNDKDLLKTAISLTKGVNNGELMQELSDIHVMAQNHMEALSIAGFNQDKLDTLEQLSNDLPRLLALANSERDDNPEKRMRDRFYTILKNDLDEIRHCGKFAFAKDKEHLKAYQSNFIKEKNKRSRQKTLLNDTKSR